MWFRIALVDLVAVRIRQFVAESSVVFVCAADAQPYETKPTRRTPLKAFVSCLDSAQDTIGRLRNAPVRQTLLQVIDVEISKVRCCGEAQAIKRACDDGIINGLDLRLQAAKTLDVFCSLFL